MEGGDARRRRNETDAAAGKERNCGGTRYNEMLSRIQNERKRLTSDIISSLKKVMREKGGLEGRRRIGEICTKSVM